VCSSTTSYSAAATRAACGARPRSSSVQRARLPPPLQPARAQDACRLAGAPAPPARSGSAWCGAARAARSGPPVPRGHGRAAGRRAVRRSWARAPWRCTRARRRGRARARGTGRASCAPGRSWTACGGGRRAAPRCGAAPPRRAPEQHLWRAGRLRALARTGCQPASCGAQLRRHGHYPGPCREQLDAVHSPSACAVPRQALPAVSGGEAGGEAQCGGLWGTRPGAAPGAPDSHGTPTPALPSLKGRRRRCHTASSWHICYSAVHQNSAKVAASRATGASHALCVPAWDVPTWEVRACSECSGKGANDTRLTMSTICEQEQRP